MQYKIPERVNRNTKVHRLGYEWPINIWWRLDFNLAVSTLEPIFGPPAREYYYGQTRDAAQIPLVRGPYAEDINSRRWYAGQRRWRYRDRPVCDFWIVFRRESDRTLALLTLG